MANIVYTLESLAREEGTTPGYVRTVVGRLKERGGDMVWRKYRFVQPGKMMWLAVPLDADIEFRLEEKEGGEDLETLPRETN